MFKGLKEDNVKFCLTCLFYGKKTGTSKRKEVPVRGIQFHLYTLETTTGVSRNERRLLPELNNGGSQDMVLTVFIL